jgi:hypothetical protein
MFVMHEGITIVSAASSNHFRSLLQCLASVPAGVRTIVYDIGLRDDERQRIPGEVRRFDFSRVPAFVHLSAPDAGAYAWKPILLYEICREVGGIVIWCDAGNLLRDLGALIQVTRHCGVYTATSLGTFEVWTHPTARRHLAGADAFLSRPMRNAACVGLDWSNPKAQYLLHDWDALARRQEISLPPGANRANHRHDQSILTYLVYAYGLSTIDAKVGHTIHNDIG